MSDLPHWHPNCRCTVEPFDELRRRLAPLEAFVPEPLPALPRVAYPSKLTSEGIHPDLFADAGTDEILRELVRKVEAEALRLRRLLPPAPDGYVWRWEVQEHDDFFDTTIRMRWILRSLATGERWDG